MVMMTPEEAAAKVESARVIKKTTIIVANEREKEKAKRKNRRANKVARKARRKNRMMR